jgi:hypothetical protein
MPTADHLHQNSPIPEPGRVVLMQSIVLLHQGHSARVLGRLVLLQSTLPEQPGTLCRLPCKIISAAKHPSPAPQQSFFDAKQQCSAAEETLPSHPGKVL